MSETPGPTPEHEHEYGVQQGELLVDGLGWVATACAVIQTISLALIAITLIARL